MTGPVLSCRRLTQLGRNAMERRDWVKAEELLGRAIKSCPADCEARRYYAETLWQRGAKNEAIEQLSEVQKRLPDDPMLIERLAEMKFELGAADEARQQVADSLDLNPRFARTWALRARMNQQNGDLRQALADYQRALSYDPENAALLEPIAHLYLQLGQPQRALANLQSLIDTYPVGEEPARVQQQLGLTYASLGRHEKAIVAYRAARQKGNATAGLIACHAESLMRTGQFEAARLAILEAQSLDPQEPRVAIVLRELQTAARPAPIPQR